MTDRWTSDQVLAVAPDPAAQRAARSLATSTKWQGAGHGDEAVWGYCQGSGKTPYQTCVDVSGPAYRCSCPSRKFPCKHALALLLLWVDGAVAESAPPDWVEEWRGSRRERAARRSTGVSDPAAAERRAAQRATRIGDGLTDLDRWLRDQVRHGLARLQHAPYSEWDGVSARLVDAQAAPVAAAVRRLATVPAVDAAWPSTLLAEFGLLRLLISAYQRRDALPGGLAATVGARAGLQAEAGGGGTLRDVWEVVGLRDEEEERLVTRRVWLRGRESGRSALVLSFAGPGQPLDASLLPGTRLDATLSFYTGALPLRAAVSERHGGPEPCRSPRAGAVTAELAGYADALAAEPWVNSWPVVLGDVVPGRLGDGWYLVDESGAALPLTASGRRLWRLVAVSGGRPMTVGGEWSPAGLRPLTVWNGEEVAVL